MQTHPEVKILTILLLLCGSFSLPRPASPLAEFSPAWNETRFLKCNTAQNTSYLTAEEKELIYIFNMMRLDPKLFAATVVKQFPKKRGPLYLENIPEYRSLLDTMSRLEPLPLLYPDKDLFESARCHAISSGEKAYVGHVRQTEECRKKKNFHAECCDYGHQTPLEMLMGLLIDENVESLGHRYICLSSFNRIGVSIQPHKRYGKNVVLDFGW